MIIKQALILSRHPKSIDELKAIMATHPWGSSVYGFYKWRAGGWSDHRWRFEKRASAVDAIWIDDGITGYDDERWLVEDYHTPDLFLCRPLSDDPLCPYERQKCELRKAWWTASLALVVHQVPDEYQACSIYYGEREDEWGGPNLPEPEPVWCGALLGHFNYLPEVKAAICADN